MATVLVVSTLLSPFSAVSTASAEDAGHLTPGIYKPTPIGIGTNINVSTSDPGVATYVGRDMYIGGKPSDTNILDASNAPAGSYAAEAEGLTVVRGKLAMNPIKESWSGHGFRFGTVGFGSQFRPSEGSTVLAVAGIDSAITSMSVGYSGDTPQATTVGAWTKGAWVGKATTGDSAGYEYTAQIAGPITYWNTNKQRQSVVKTQSNWSDGGLFSGDDNGASIMSNINGKDYTKYLQSEVKAKISAPLAKLKTTGEYKVGVAEQNSKYMIKKYNNKEQYGLTFDDSIKTFKRKTNYTDVNGKNVSGKVALVNNEKLIKFTGDADANGNGSPLQVFYLKASDLTNSIGGTTYRGVDFSFDMIPTDASVVVNIIDDDEAGQTATPVEFNTGWRFWWNGKEISRGYEEGSDVESQYSTAAQSILWNFTTAKQVTIRGGMALEGNKDLDSKADGKWTDDDPAAAMLGSIVVPNGSFEDHVTTNGRVYVGGDFEMYNPTEAWKFNPDGSSASVIDMDQERHNFPWSASYTPDGSSIAWSKVDAADGTTLLPGSSWTIYGTVDDAKNGKNPIVTVTDGAANDYASTDGELQFNYLNQKANPSTEISDSNLAFIYYIKEVTAPEGYQVSDKIYYATMNNAGESVNYVQGYVNTANDKLVQFDSSNPTGAIPNAKITGTVSWTKVEDGDAKFAPLAGSEWKLAKLGTDGSTEAQSWTVSDQSAPSGTTWADTDTAPGKFTLEGLLPGTYTLVETQAPIGYELNEKTYKFTVDSTNGSITWTEEKGLTIDGNNVYISDTLATTSVTIPVTKSVRNTDWPKDANDNYVSFDFKITATSDPAAPMPGETTIHVAPTDESKVNDIVANFGKITFCKDHLATIDASNPTGEKTYTYMVKEVAPATGAVNKLRYSKAEYQVAVTVKADMTNGKRSGLTTSTTVTQVKDDMGNALGKDGQGVEVQPSAAAPDAIPASTFTNVKVLTDLPLTGAGWTENSMLLVGAGLMLLSGIAAGAYWFATKRRQDDPSDGAGR